MSSSPSRSIADLHTHTPLCGHASGTPEQYAKRALELGLSHYGVSDHFPLSPEDFPPASQYLPLSRYQEYRDWMAKMHALLCDTPVKLLSGVEFDFLPGQMDITLPFLHGETGSLDYRIFSIHFVNSYPIDNPPRGRPSKWAESDGPRQIWSAYVDTLAQMVRLGGFEIIGHVDLPKIYGVFPENYRKIILAIHDVLKVASEKGICMEINTAGLRKPVGEMYPSAEILKMAFDAGVNITLGSDAHAPGQLAFAFDRAMEIARDVGYKSVCAFEKFVPVELPITSGVQSTHL